MSSLQPQNLNEALAQHTRAVKRDTWTVLNGTSTTEFTVQLGSVPGTVPNLDTGAQNDLTGEIVVFHSGANVGVERAIASVVYASNALTITLAVALPNTPTAGDRFAIYSAKMPTSNVVSASIAAGVFDVPTAAGQLPSQSGSEVLIQAAPGNADNVQIGTQTTQPIVLVPGQSVSMAIDNLNLLWAIASATGNTLGWLVRS